MIGTSFQGLPILQESEFLKGYTSVRLNTNAERYVAMDKFVLGRVDV